MPDAQTGEETAPRVLSAAKRGNLLTTPGKSRAILLYGGCARAFFRDAEFAGQGQWVRVRAIDVMSLPFGATMVSIPDRAFVSWGVGHDFVIVAS